MATREQKNATDLGEQAIALAEQLGRIAGTIEGTAESWMNRQALTDQLTRVRDSATQMLEGLTGGTAKKAGKRRARNPRAPRPRGRPTLRTRPASAAASPAPTMKGVKKSDQRIPKMRTAAVVRQRGRLTRELRELEDWKIEDWKIVGRLRSADCQISFEFLIYRSANLQSANTLSILQSSNLPIHD